MIRALTAAAALLLLAGCTPAPPHAAAQACAAPLKPALQVDLYFGLVANGREISEAEWAAFLQDQVTPRFPDGLSVVDIAGQYRHPAGFIARERSKLLIIVVLDAPGHLPKVQAIVDTYKRQFNQLSVLHVEHAICAVF